MRVACASGSSRIRTGCSILHHSPLRGVEHILHAGDIGRGDVLARLERIASVTAVSGNVDGFDASKDSMERTVDLAGHRIAIYHRLYEGGRLTREGWLCSRVSVHRQCVWAYASTEGRMARRVLLFNPGSAGPKRFRLPRAVGLLLFQNGSIETQHIMLGVRRNDSPAADAGIFCSTCCGGLAIMREEFLDSRSGGVIHLLRGGGLMLRQFIVALGVVAVASQAG